jgi:hypothetical protein
MTTNEFAANMFGPNLCLGEAASPSGQLQRLPQ